MDSKLDTDNAPQLLNSIIGLIDTTRQNVARTVNQELTLLYWNIGKSINDDVLKNDRADYGKKIIPELSDALTNRYGIGFSKRNLQGFIKLSAVFEDFTILHTVCAKLSWSHIRNLIYIENLVKREFYIQMAIHERWSVRTLQDRIDSMLFERTAISKKPEQTIINELKVLETENKISPDLAFRDPYFLDFLGLHDTYSERDLESSILAQLQYFITEMGSEFAFLARQKRITIDNEDFYIDLLFYHRGLKSLVAIDLKLGKFKAGYKGQMELYLSWLEYNEQKEGENKPIGLILCSEKSPEQINYLMLGNDEHIKVAEYLTQLPKKELLLEKLEKAIAIADPFIIPYKKYAYFNIFFNVLYALFGTLSFVSLIPMMQVLFDQTKKNLIQPIYEGFINTGDFVEDTKHFFEGTKHFFENYLSYYITNTTQNFGVGYTLSIMVVVIITVFLLKNLSDYLALFFITFLRNGVLRDMRNAMYKKTINLPISFFSEKRKGDTISRISADVNEVQTSFLSILEIAVKEPLTIIFTIIAMLLISAKLTLFVFIFIPLSGYVISLIGKQLKKKSTRAQQEQGIFLSTIEETLGGLKVVKGYNSEKYFNRIFQESTQRFFVLSNSIGNRQNLASPASEFMGIMVIAILLWYGGHMVLIEKTLNGASFIAYMGLAYNILTPAKSISKASYAIKRGNAAAERVLEILDQENTIKSKKDALLKDTFESEISIKNINFKYEEETVLKNFSLEVKKGQTVALVGQSGSGKSTIASLLTRFYDVNEGTISIDGNDIKDLNLQSLRGLMGLVTQDSILFNDTIKANISLGKLNATDDEITEALKIANAYEFVKDLPLGIYTNIGDSGNKLSGGQKQRLSIARAVLKNPPIMILDEATSALDTESEKFVQVALENMMQNRTSIVIAHRLSTIQKADKIVVLQKGEIVEQGNHEELIALNGTYHKLVTMQSFE